MQAPRPAGPLPFGSQEDCSQHGAQKTHFFIPQRPAATVTNGLLVQTVQIRGQDACPPLIWINPNSSSHWRSPPGKHPASLFAGVWSLNATWTQRKGAGKEPFGE